MILSFIIGLNAIRSLAGLSTVLSRVSSSLYHLSTSPLLAAIFQEVRILLIAMSTDN